MAIKQCVEGVKELLLRTFLAGQKLNVVDAKQIRLTVALPEFDQIVVLDRVDEFVDEQFARKVNHLRIFLLCDDVLPNRLHQVGLAETDAAVNEKRVIGASRGLSDRKAGRMRDLIVWPDHE